MRLAQKTLDKLPTVRLYFGEKNFYTVPYLNAATSVNVPLSLDHFKPNGRGIPWTCGVSNAINAHKNLFSHPVFYAHTIGTATYVVAMVDKGGLPRLVIRYSHGAGPKIAAYDKSLKDPTFLTKLQKMLQASPVLHLRKGAVTGGVGAHSPHFGGRTHSNPSADANKQGLRGNAKRMANAGFLPAALVDQFAVG